MELYNVKIMPLSNDSNRRMAQERFARGERFATLYGRDQSKIKKELGTYQCKPNYCYRAISQETYELYKNSGFISDNRPNAKEYMESVDENGKVFTNNSGIDWFLGGAAPGSEYGMIVIECPADVNYFQPAFVNGCDLPIDPNVRHMKSSPKANPIPFSMITNVFDYKKIKEQAKAEFDTIRQQEVEKMTKLRQQQLIPTNQLQETQQRVDNITGGKSR